MRDERFDNDLFRGLPQADDLRKYVEHGTPMNHFLTAVLENDLMTAIGRADSRNKAALEAYVIWLKSYAPAACYGSPANVAAWSAQRGLHGLSKAQNTPGS